LPLLRAIGAWLMARGIDPGQPGWAWVVSGFLFPLFLFVLLVALLYELVIRLDVGKWLGSTAHWVLAVAAATAASIGVIAWLVD
jgi:hypothetical protein